MSGIERLVGRCLVLGPEKRGSALSVADFELLVVLPRGMGIQTSWTIVLKSIAHINANDD